MLVLGRKVNESIVIGNDIVVTVFGIQDGRVRLGVEAPKEMPVSRRSFISGKQSKKEEKDNEKDKS